MINTTASYQQTGFVFNGEEIQPKKQKRSRGKLKAKSSFEKLDFMAILFPEDYSEEYLKWIHEATSFTWIDDDIYNIGKLMFEDAIDQLRNIRVSKAALDDILAWIFDAEGEPVETDFSFKNVCHRIHGVSATLGRSAFLQLIESEVSSLKKLTKPKYSSEYRLAVFYEVLRVYSDEIENLRIELNELEGNASLSRLD